MPFLGATVFFGATLGVATLGVATFLGSTAFISTVVAVLAFALC